MDTDFAPARQGLRMYRMGLTGVAKELAQSLTLEQMSAPNGLQVLLEYFDKLCASYLEILDERDYEQAIHRGHRQPN